MTDAIICPHCKNSIPLTQALTHQMNEQMEQKLDEVKKKAEEREKYLIELGKKRVEEEREKASKEVEVTLRKKIAEEMELKLKDTQNESEELKKEKKALQDQLLELNKLIRQLQNQNREKEIELTKKFNEEQENIRKEEQKKIEEQFKLRDMEKDKKLQDMTKQIEDLKRKAEQGSQQMQGEILELAVEGLLQKAFPFDEIKPVPKGITGADIIQMVHTSPGKHCGSIIWELKRTKAWSPQWIGKLKDDQRAVSADLAVIVSQIVPDSVKRFGFSEGIWICDFESIMGVAYALRNQLVEVNRIKSSLDGKKEKAEVLYQYINSIEFRHRMETIVEAFHGIQEEIEKEKRWFAQKWAREEKNLRKVLDNTYGLDGELQSIMGKSITELKIITQATEITDGQEEGKLF